jgi:hypothetical protein
MAAVKVDAGVRDVLAQHIEIVAVEQFVGHEPSRPSD